MFASGIQDFAHADAVISPTFLVATANSGSFDSRGLRGTAFLLATSTWASGQFTLKIQHAPPKADGTAPESGDYVDLAGSELTILQSNGPAQQIRLCVREGSANAYLRLRVESPSGSPAACAFAFGIDPFADKDPEVWDVAL